MATDQPTRVPVSRADGSVTFALVDAVDFPLVHDGNWRLIGKGYAASKGVLMHRLLLGLAPNDGMEGDHINLDRLDNRRRNLRIVPKGKNQQNTRSRQGSTSQYRGVSWNTRERKWVAQARTGGRNFHLGLFDVEEDAAEAARLCRLEHMPYSVEPT